MASPFTVSPQLTNVQTLAKDLLRSVSELGPLASTRNLQADLSGLVAYCEDRGVDVDVVVASPISPAAARSLAGWLSPSLDPFVLDSSGSGVPGDVTVTLADGHSVARIMGTRMLPIQKVGAPRPAVLVTVGGSFDALEPEQQEVLGEIMEDRALVLLVNAVGEETSAPLQVLAQQRQAAAVEAVNVSALPMNGWHLRLESGPMAALTPVLRGFAALHGIETAAKAVRLVIDQEQRGLKVKRALAQQESAKLQQPASNPMELITETRTRLQRTFAEFERSVQEGLRSLFLPQVGSLAQSVEQRLLQLNKFQEQKGEKTIALRIADSVEAEFFMLVRQACRDHCLRDVARLQTLFDIATTEGNRSLASAGAPAVIVRHAMISEMRLNRMLESAVRIDRPYRGELPNHGIQEYIQQVKKYLNILGALTVGSLSLTKLLPPKAVLGVTLASIAAGLATLPHRIKRERAENHFKELDRARDAIRGEARRMFSEIEREWLAIVGEALRDEQTFVMQEFESSVREGQSLRTTELADDRRRLQRQTSGMDNTERLLAAAKRTRDTVENAVGQLRNALRQQLAALGTPVRRPT